MLPSDSAIRHYVLLSVRQYKCTFCFYLILFLLKNDSMSVNDNNNEFLSSFEVFLKS